MALGDLMSSRFSQAWASVSNHLDEVSGLSGEDGDDASFVPRRASEAPSGVDRAAMSMAYLPQTVVLRDYRHECLDDYVHAGPSDAGLVSKWRPKDRLKTGCVALVVCLNIGYDPPDVIKISPCARMECWIDPFSMAASKAVDQIGKALHAQYFRWQPRARFRVQLDPTIEEVKKLCISCRKNTRSERVLFHYNGHGVPKPTENGEIWVFNKDLTQYLPLPISDLDSWLRSPSIYVFDCSAAGLIVREFIERLELTSTSSSVSSIKDIILLAACGADETLPLSAEFPADVFTSCLTTPIKMALNWFCKRSLLHDSLNHSMIDKIPGCQTDRKTLLGELNWIFTAVTDTIAWNVLPHDLFQRLFRKDLLVASLCRNFLLAERVMKAANCSPVSYPRLPSTYQHHMWDAWDMAAEICLSQLPQLLNDPNAEYLPSHFFSDQLTAFEVWLDHGSENKKPPEQLPIVLQVLLSQSHRFRALVLLGRFLDMGPWAVDLALSVGIFPYVLKLLQTTALELRQILVFIWTKILALDKSCQVDLVKDEGHTYFIKYLDSLDAFPEQRAMAAFILAVIVDGHRQGQEACIQANLLEICLKQLQQATSHTEPLLLQWLCLCLGKLWENFPEARLIALQADAPSIFASLLSEPQPEVRAAATFALGTLLEIGTDALGDEHVSSEGCDDGEKEKVEFSIAKSLLQVVSDGCPLVRSEVAVALSRFALGHTSHLKLVAAAYLKPNNNSLLNSLPSLANISKPSPSSYIYPGSSLSFQIRPVLKIGGDNIAAIRDGRVVSTSSPLSSSGIMHGSPVSDDSSQHSDSGILLKENSSNGVINYSMLKPFGNSIYLQCVLSMSDLAKDPLPRVASLAKKMLTMIGVEQVVTKLSRFHFDSNHQCDFSTPTMAPCLAGLARSSSWFEMNAGHLSTTFRTPPVSPPRQNYITGLRRVCSMEFRPYQISSPEAGLAGPFLSCGTSASNESSLLPHSTIFNWSCGYFTKSLLSSADDDEELIAKRENRERIALDHIAKCQHSYVGKFGNPIASWDTKFETGTKAAVFLPLSPVVVAADENERIRVWNYEEATSLNNFCNRDLADRGISKLCLVNELDDILLLVASCDGNVRLWKDFSVKGKQKLVTAFSSLQGHKSVVHSPNAVVDWQQQSGYLYSANEMSSIMLWDLDKEHLISSIPTLSESSISALSASQVHGGHFAAGFVDGSVRLFDIRTPEMIFCTANPHRQSVERVVGIGFQPGLDLSKIVSASQAGDIQFLDMRHDSESYLTIESHRGSLTALAIHRHAPVIASGSSKQIVKVFSLEGLPLGTIRYYHPTFMAQRIGSVSCLTFHPYKALLAAGASDPCLSIYPDDHFFGK